MIEDMKPILTTLCMLMLTVSMVRAQTVTEAETSMSLGAQNGFYVDIDGADEKITEKVFKKFIKDFGKVKNNKKAKEYFAESIQLPMVNGTDDVALYVKFDERVEVTTVYAWVDLGGEFVDSNDNPKEAKGMESFLTDLYVAVKKAAIEEEMEDAEKEMKDLDKGMDKLEKENKGYHEDIEKAKQKIEEAEKNIEQNLRDQDDQKVMMAKQKEKLEEIVSRLNSVGKN